MNYQRNKELSKTRDRTPTLTDQSQARETNINIIVGRMLKTGQVPGAPKQPLYLDTSEMPETLAEAYEQIKALQSQRAKLPEQLRGMPIEQLLSLTPEQLNSILKPPAKPAEPPQPPAQPKEETK